MFKSFPVVFDAVYSNSTPSTSLITFPLFFLMQIQVSPESNNIPYTRMSACSDIETPRSLARNGTIANAFYQILLLLF